MYCANVYQKKDGVAIFISNKIDSKIKCVKEDKKRHYIIIKGQSNSKI